MKIASFVRLPLIIILCISFCEHNCQNGIMFTRTCDWLMMFPHVIFVNLMSRSCWSLYNHPSSAHLSVWTETCPRGIFGTIYENKNMERIIEQKPGSSAMITLIPYHISKWGYHPVEYWCIYLYKVNEYQICTLTKKYSENSCQLP